MEGDSARERQGTLEREIDRHDIGIRFGENLVRCRRQLTISQEDLARRASLHRTEIGMLENARRGGRIDTLVKLRGALGISADELLEGLDWVPAPGGGGVFWIRRPGLEVT